MTIIARLTHFLSHATNLYKVCSGTSGHSPSPDMVWEPVPSWLAPVQPLPENRAGSALVGEDCLHPLLVKTVLLHPYLPFWQITPPGHFHTSCSSASFCWLSVQASTFFASNYRLSHLFFPKCTLADFGLECQMSRILDSDCITTPSSRPTSCHL